MDRSEGEDMGEATRGFHSQSKRFPSNSGIDPPHLGLRFSCCNDDALGPKRFRDPLRALRGRLREVVDLPQDPHIAESRVLDRRQVSFSTAAPPMQSAQSCGFSPQTAPTSSSTTISASCRCPPRLSTRKISWNAAGLSGTRFSTPLLVTTSTLPSGSGIFVASPSRIWTFRTPIFAMLVRAFAIIAGVMSKPYTVPFGPTFSAAYKTSVPEPEPMSSTLSPVCITFAACGYPTPANDSVAVGGSFWRSSSG